MKLVGYRFMRPDLKEAAMVILKIGDEKTLYNNLVNVRGDHSHYCLNKDSILSNRAKDAGVLDTWFEPVYETITYERRKVKFFHDDTWYVDNSNPKNIIYHSRDGKCWGLIYELWRIVPNIYTTLKQIRWIEISHNNPIIGDMLLAHSTKLGLTNGTTVLDVDNEYQLYGKAVYNVETNMISCSTTSKYGGRLLLMSDGVWVKKIEVPKIKDYTWYKLDGNILIFHTTGEKGYGLYNGTWEPLSDKENYSFKIKADDWTEVPIDSVNHTLTQYARGKGYIKNNDFLTWNPNVKSMTRNVTDIILNDEGVWNDNKCIVNGYEAELSGKYIKFGCAYLKLGWFLESSNRHITELTLSSGVVLHEEDMERIRAFIKKNVNTPTNKPVNFKWPI